MKEEYGNDGTGSILTDNAFSFLLIASVTLVTEHDDRTLLTGRFRAGKTPSLSALCVGSK